MHRCSACGRIRNPPWYVLELRCTCPDYLAGKSKTHRCPTCGGSLQGGLASTCSCRRDAADQALKIGATFDWISPASDLTGIPAGCFIIIAILAIAVLAVYAVADAGFI